MRRQAASAPAARPNQRCAQQVDHPAARRQRQEAERDRDGLVRACGPSGVEDDAEQLDAADGAWVRSGPRRRAFSRARAVRPRPARRACRSWRTRRRRSPAARRAADDPPPGAAAALPDTSGGPLRADATRSGSRFECPPAWVDSAKVSQRSLRSSGQSLYRRHRPRTFAEVVGQEPVVRTLRNAVERDKVHHAYLFVGSRGTGKTSMAKILAACLNCGTGRRSSPAARASRARRSRARARWT